MRERDGERKRFYEGSRVFCQLSIDCPLLPLGERRLGEFPCNKRGGDSKGKRKMSERRRHLDILTENEEEKSRKKGRKKQELYDELFSARPSRQAGDGLSWGGGSWC